MQVQFGKVLGRSHNGARPLLLSVPLLALVSHLCSATIGAKDNVPVVGVGDPQITPARETVGNQNRIWLPSARNKTHG